MASGGKRRNTFTAYCAVSGCGLKSLKM